MTDGSVRYIRVVRPCPYDVLNNSALDAIKSAAPFSQKPKELEGKEITMEIEIRFRLE
jgi:TonB family protein